LNIISSTPEEVMREISVIEKPTNVQKVNSNTISEIRSVMGDIDSFVKSSGIFNSVGPFVISWK
jgi:hypothetical protein